MQFLNSHIKQNHKKWLKSLLSVIIALSILLNSFGYLFILFSLKELVKKDMREYIRNNTDIKELEKISIPLKIIDSYSHEFRLLEDDEFVYQGRMYDVVKAEKNESQITFYCINDKKEENVNQRIEKNVTGNIKDIIIKSIKIFSPYFLNNIQFNVLIIIGLHILQHADYDNILKGFPRINIPPPRLQSI
jgi:hypothetical protein